MYNVIIICGKIKGAGERGCPFFRRIKIIFSFTVREDVDSVFGKDVAESVVRRQYVGQVGGLSMELPDIFVR